jgi:tetratricopeptide (TPR) repeat protein
MNPIILLAISCLFAAADLTPEEQEKVKLSSAKWSVASMKADKLVAEKKYAEAEAIYTDILNQRIALKLDPLPEYEKLAPLYEAWGRKEKAEQAYRDMLSSREKLNEGFDDQTTEYPLEELAKFLQRNGRAQEAKPLRVRIAKIERDMNSPPKFGPMKSKPGSPEAVKEAQSLRTQGERFVKADQQWKALFYFQRAVRLNPRDAQAWCDLGDMYWFKENVPQAKIAYQKAIDLNPKLSKAYIGRAWLREGVKDYKGALADFEKAYTINPKDVEAMGDAAKLMDNIGRHKEAVALYTRVIETNPALYWPLVQRSTAYANLKDFSHAIADMTTLIKRAPEDPDFYEFRAQVYKKMGDKASAAADMAMMKKLNNP